MKVQKLMIVGANEPISQDKLAILQSVVNANNWCVVTDGPEAMLHVNAGMMLDAIKLIAYKHKDFLNELTNVVIDLHNDDRLKQNND